MDRTAAPARLGSYEYWYWSSLSYYYSSYLQAMWAANGGRAPQHHHHHHQSPEKTTELERQWMEYFRTQSQAELPPSQPEPRQHDERPPQFSQPTTPPAPQTRSIDVVVLPYGVEANKASIGQRLTAEVIDFVIMVLFRYFVIISIIGVPTTIPFLSLFELTEDGVVVVDDEMFIENIEAITTAILAHAAMVIAYETLLTYIWGGTIGKLFVGIRIVSCDTVQMRTNQSLRMSVYPGSEMTLGQSVSRAILKNMSQTMLFPMYLTVLMNKPGRAAYDVMAGSIVIQV
ncbi:protein FAM8A1-like [Oscarella lobularis]|uniref:protein FAM8A1-like n=1 Tax=Oscarella lobularis TaxID=121494 RepID=UPI0033138A88